MISNFLKFSKYSFSTSLKEKKTKIIKNMNLEKVIKENELKMAKKEKESIYENLKFNKILFKLSLFTIIPTTAYFIYNSNNYPRRSKKLTDAFNIALNGVVTSSSLYVNYKYDFHTDRNIYWFELFSNK